jgi:hypothetical protein
MAARHYDRIVFRSGFGGSVSQGTVAVFDPTVLEDAAHPPCLRGQAAHRIVSRDARKEGATQSRTA